MTRNSVDFRGPAEQPGSKGQYADVAIHAGLVCIHGPARVSGKIQVELFAAVLDMIQEATPPQEDLVNEVIEVDLAEEGREFEIIRYPMPVADESKHLP